MFNYLKKVDKYNYMYFSFTYKLFPDCEDVARRGLFQTGKNWKM